MKFYGVPRPRHLIPFDGVALSLPPPVLRGQHARRTRMLNFARRSSTVWREGSKNIRRTRLHVGVNPGGIWLSLAVRQMAFLEALNGLSRWCSRPGPVSLLSHDSPSRPLLPCSFRLGADLVHLVCESIHQSNDELPSLMEDDFEWAYAAQDSGRKTFGEILPPTPVFALLISPPWMPLVLEYILGTLG